MGFKIIGTGRYIPEKILTNDDLAKMVDTTDEWIVSHTGIKQRHIMEKDFEAGQVVSVAAKKALDMAGINAEDLDLIICSTIKSDYYTPSLACTLQSKIGAKCPAFDINAACSGFIYGLDIADKYFTDKKYKYILMLSYEVMSQLVDWQDRSTCVLFGDGCGCAVLENSDEPVYIKLSANGNSDILNISNKEGQKHTLHMNGPQVYKFAVSSACKDIPYILSMAGINQNDVNHVILHQANKRIIEGVSQKIDIPNERFRINIQEYGNTSSAGIPILIDELNCDGMLHKGDKIILCAFGGGLTCGTCFLTW
ncbi:MAG: ketoacyl-ACP synthase III [Clostridia bacterium]|nr:ketoacyl-ACP synthase III [Clostridia bacterium]